MLKGKKNKIMTFLLSAILVSGIGITASAETYNFDEMFYLTKTGYTGEQTKGTTGYRGHIATSSVSGCTSVVVTLVNHAEQARSDAYTIDYSKFGPYYDTISCWSNAEAGYWYRYKMVVPVLGSRLKGTFNVG